MGEAMVEGGLVSISGDCGGSSVNAGRHPALTPIGHRPYSFIGGYSARCN